MRKPNNPFTRRSVLSAALVGALTASAVAQADHRAGDSYYAWVDVVSVQPRYVEHTVHESVERCYDVRQSRGRAVGHGRQDRYSDWRDDRGRASGNGGSLAATIIGGVIGGAIGNELGGGGRNRGITAAGAVIGATIANSAVSQSRTTVRNAPRYDSRYDQRRSTQVSRRCEVVSEPRNVSYVDGYNVTYRYQGQRFTKVLDQHPGNRMQVRVDVQPVI